MNESSRLRINVKNNKPLSEINLNLVQPIRSNVNNQSKNNNLTKSASTTDIDQLNIVDSKSSLSSNLTTNSLNAYYKSKSKTYKKNNTKNNDDNENGQIISECEEINHELKKNLASNINKSQSTLKNEENNNNKNKKLSVHMSQTISTITLSSSASNDVILDYDSDGIQIISQQENHLDSKLIDLIFQHNYNLIEIEYKFKKLNNNLFIKIIHITETYNRFINYFYTQKSKPNLYLNNINLVLFIRSITNIKSKDIKDSNYFIFILKTLIRIMLIDEKMFDNKTLFDFDLKNLILDKKNSNYISLTEKCWIILKISNKLFDHRIKSESSKLALHYEDMPCSSYINNEADSKSCELSQLLLEPSDDSVLDSLNKCDCLDSLNEETKLDLIQRFIDIIMINLNSYRLKLDFIESEIHRLKADLRVFKSNKEKIEHNHNLYDIKSIYSIHNLVNTETANQALYLENCIITNENDLKNNTKRLDLFSRQNYFSQVYLNDSNCLLKFWFFDTLKDCLIIERQPFFLDFNQQQDINSITSQWYLINDLEHLKYLLNVFNTQLMDSTLTNTILDIISNIEKSKSSYPKAESNNNAIPFNTIRFNEFYHLQDYDLADDDDELCDYNNKSDVPISLSDYISYYHYLLEFKNRLLASNFINYKIIFSNNDNSIDDFQIDDSVRVFYEIETEYDALESTFSKTDLIHLMKKIYEKLYEMLDKNNYLAKKFKSHYDKILFELIQKSESLGRLKYLINIFNNNIRWDLSIRKNKCSICLKNEEKLGVKMTSSLKSIVEIIKQKCHECDNYFHLKCIINMKLNIEKNSTNKNDCKVYDLFKYGRSKICNDCYEKRSNEKAKQINESNKLNSIEVGNKQLRLNKARVAKLEKIDSEEEGLPTKRTKSSIKNFIDNKSDDDELGALNQKKYIKRMKKGSDSISKSSSKNSIWSSSSSNCNEFSSIGKPSEIACSISLRPRNKSVKYKFEDRNTDEDE